jgi:hypothetical protein
MPANSSGGQEAAREMKPLIFAAAHGPAPIATLAQVADHIEHVWSLRLES